MRKAITLLFLLAILVLPISAHAQSEVTLETVRVKLWPEFDQRAVLVIYQMELAADTPLPAAVSVNIPASTGGPSAVALIVEDGGLVSADFTTQENGGWLTVNITAETSGLWVEYYDASLAIDGTNREFDFTWVGNHPVSHLEIELQRPADVTLITTSPALGVGGLESDGLTYYRQDFGAVAAGEPFEISTSYEKTSEALTVETLDTPDSTPTGLKINWPWVIGVFVVGLMGYGIYTFFGIGQPTRSKRRRKQSSTAKGRSRPSAAKASVFCHNCGTQALKGDKYCRECGEKLRV
jgi:hypothetical protein